MTENVILPVQAEKSAVKNVILKSLVITLFAAATIFLSFVPGQITTPDNNVYVLAMVLIWAYFIARTISQKGENHPDIAILVYGTFILWEVLFRIKNIGNPTLEPPLENVIISPFLETP